MTALTVLLLTYAGVAVASWVSGYTHGLDRAEEDHA